MSKPHFYDIHSGDARFFCPVQRCYTGCYTLEALLNHAKNFTSLKTLQDHSFLMKLMQDRICTIVGCGQMIEDFQELFQHMEKMHNWVWTRRNDPEFKYTFGTDAHGPTVFGKPLCVPESSSSGPASTLPLSQITYPTESFPLVQSQQNHRGKTIGVPWFLSSDLQHAIAVQNVQRQKEEERKECGNDPEKSNKTEAHYADKKSLKEEDSENSFSLTEFPKSREEVNTLQKLLFPTRMQYKYLTGSALFMCDILSKSYLMEWHDMQMSLENWWNTNGKTSQVPELIFIGDWSAERVVWTYEWDAKIFGPVLDLRDLVRTQEFKNLSPILPKCLAG